MFLIVTRSFPPDVGGMQILMGGLSDERVISFLSGKACSKALIKKGFKVSEVDAKGYFINKLRKLQLPLELKKKKSHYIIKNNFKDISVKKNAKRVMEKILLNA